MSANRRSSTGPRGRACRRSTGGGASVALGEVMAGAGRSALRVRVGLGGPLRIRARESIWYRGHPSVPVRASLVPWSLANPDRYSRASFDSAFRFRISAPCEFNRLPCSFTLSCRSATDLSSSESDSGSHCCNASMALRLTNHCRPTLREIRAPSRRSHCRTSRSTCRRWSRLLFASSSWR